MKKGRAPIWKDGTVIELHHLIQREPGSMVEIPASMHDEYSKNFAWFGGEWWEL